MALPTVAELCEAVPHDLTPAEGFTPPDVEVTAVHVSELLDPTPYLTGGELLLTTGLSLPATPAGCEDYVAALHKVGVSALGLGLGPALNDVPDHLAEACRSQDVTLLVVPPAAAFLTVSKAYWGARSRTSQRELTDAITTHAALVNAAVSSDPVGETLRTLSRAIGGWVAKLDGTGALEQVYPSGRVNDAVAVSGQIGMLHTAGAHSAATFPSGDDMVVVFPLPLADRVVGYLAVGASHRLRATDRRLAITAGGLLSLDSVQRQRADAGHHARLQSVATLVDMGQLEAARRLTSRMGLPALGDAVRVVAVRSTRPADAAEAVHRWTSDVFPSLPEGDHSWFIAPALQPPADSLAAPLRQRDPSAAAVVSDIVPIGSVHDVRLGLLSMIASVSDGQVSTPQSAGLRTEGLEAALQRVLAYSRADLVGALAAYLRHRGQWDPAARDLRVHRNTLRHRLTRCRELMGVDIDDPDVSAELWIYLRSNGLA